MATSINHEGEATKAKGSNDIQKLISEKMEKNVQKI